MLVILVAASFGYSYLLQESKFSDWWVAGLLGLSLTTVVANIWGVLQVLGQYKASNKPASQWRDRDLIGVSGRLQALRVPVTAPFSGQASTIVEYDVKRVQHSNNSTSTVSDYQGFLMTPCAIHSQRGALRLVGFPITSNVPLSQLSEDDSAPFINAGKYLKSCKFKEHSANPLKALAELRDVLGDEDGDLKVDFISKGAQDLSGYATDLSQAESNNITEVDHDKTEDEQDLDEQDVGDSSDAVLTDQELGQMLQSKGYLLEERCVPNGAEVTLFGTFDAKRNQIDIGSGIKNISHQLHIGKIGPVLSRNLRRAILALIFWGALCGGANWYVLSETGLIG